MTTSIGTYVGPYELVEWLGAGGMGVVYRARDSRLGREVALKLIAQSVDTDPDRVRRFEQEARAAGQLNHPNILTVYDVGTHAGAPYIVAELLEGDSLRNLLAAGAPPVRKAVEYARQLCEGLAAAHDKGIVHRDIKPDNVFVTRDARVKILDFGIAKLKQPYGGANRAAATETAADAVLGTPCYMSPEQVRGKDVDARADLFAVGAVLYELLSGRRAFPGDTPAEMTAAILKDTPPQLPTRTELSPALTLIVQRCLEKDPIERFQSARDLAFALHNVARLSDSGVTDKALGPATRTTSAPLRWALVVVALVGAGAVGWWAHSRQVPTTVASPATFAQLIDLPGIERSPSVSPDGTMVVYESDAAGNFDIYSLRTGGRNPSNLTADSADADSTPVLSPTGSHIAFRSERAGGGIFIMGATGESVRRVSDFGYNPSWSPDGTRLVVSSIGSGSTPYERAGTGTLSIVAVATGERRLLNIPFDAVQPRWSPLGRHIAFWSVERGTARRDIWTIAVDPPGKPVRVTNDAAIDWTPVWAHDGRHLLFASDRGGVMNLWRVPMNENTGEPIGTPEPLTVPTAFVSGFSLTQDGRIVFANTDVRTRVMRLDFDPAREAVTSVSVLLESPRIYRYPDWSPDSETLVFSTFGAAENLHVIRADGSGYRQLTDDDFNNRGPRWFPDGVRVLFYSNRSGTYQAWSIRSDGSSPQQLTHSPTSVVLPVLSPAADRIAYRPSMSSRWSIAELRSPGAEHVTDMPPPPQEANISPNSWSKDMSRLALFEQLVAEPRIFVFALATKVYERLPVAGWNPSWLPDGRRLLFSSRQGVQLIDTVTGRTREVYKLTAGLATQNASFALSADGGRIALLALDERSDLWMMNPN